MKNYERRHTMARFAALICLAGAIFTGFAPGTAPAADPTMTPTVVQDGALATDWVTGHKSRTRLTAGSTAALAGQPGQLYAFVEIELAEGWKTYWKSPGDSGIPPRFEFAKSGNLRSAEVLYPAPKRIADKGDVIIGYAGTVAFPVVLTAEDPLKPIELAADVQFGMCKDICVPTEARLKLIIPSDAQGALSFAATASLGRVPHPREAQTVSDPKIASLSVDLKSVTPQITLTAEFPSGAEGADAFLEAPNGLYLPLLTKTAQTGSSVTFAADVSKDVDLAALAGKFIAVTLISDAGAAESSFKFE